MHYDELGKRMGIFETESSAMWDTTISGSLHSCQWQACTREVVTHLLLGVKRDCFNQVEERLRGLL
jgi:hypothetical protein